MQMLNPDLNTLHIRIIITDYLSPNGQDKMRAITYLKDHPAYIPGVILTLQQQGRVQEAQQLQMETQQQQPPYRYSILQQQQQPQVPMAPSQMQIHQQGIWFITIQCITLAENTELVRLSSAHFQKSMCK